MKCLFIDKSDIDQVWNEIQYRHLIYHQVLAPGGEFDRVEFQRKMAGVQGFIMLDRNILSGLLKACEQGTLEETELQNIGLIMFWSFLNRLELSPGFAVQEYSTRTREEADAATELQKFQEIQGQYNPYIWRDVALKRVCNIPKLNYSGERYPTTISNTNGCYHYYIALASMVHLVRLIRDQSKSLIEKLEDFYQWTYDNVITSIVILVYAILLLKNKNGIKAPKNSNSKDVATIIKGCENQAWDLSYLAYWIRISQDFSYDKTVFFSTNDKLLQILFGYVLEALQSKEFDWARNKGILTKKECAAIMKVTEDNKRTPPIVDELFIERVKQVAKFEEEKLGSEIR